MWEKMDFITSIKTCFVKYVDFRGRASRSEFWYFTLFITVISICAGIIDASLAGQTFWSDRELGPAWWVFNVLIFLPDIAVSISRLHDINKSGWWWLLLFTVVGIIPLVYWLVKKSDQSPNDFGNPTSQIQEEEKI